MIGTLLKLLAYYKAPKATFGIRHPAPAVQMLKTPFDLRTAYAPRIAAGLTLLLVAPIAYRLGKAAGRREATAPTPRQPSAIDATVIAVSRGSPRSGTPGGP
jgi:hypothetical protein